MTLLSFSQSKDAYEAWFKTALGPDFVVRISRKRTASCA